MLICFAELLEKLIPLIPVAINVISFFGIFGLSSMTLLAEYFIQLIFAYLSIFHLLASKLFFTEIGCLVSLWNLFRGKKWNILHSRLDSADYTLDQLLLGTVFFTVLVFLFPTIAVYCLLFAAVLPAHVLWHR